MTHGQHVPTGVQCGREWSALCPGVHVNVVKLGPDGAETARYSGEVVGTFEPGRWRIVQAVWTYKVISMDGLSFEPGDLLLEWFSPDLPFNAFAVFTCRGRLRGWYANVALPAFLGSASSDGMPTVVWHDLYLDLVGLQDGRYAMRDHDELEASALAAHDPGRYRDIIAAGRELTRRFTTGEPPFVSPAELAAFLRLPNEPENRA